MATQNLAYLITVNDAELRLAQSHIASFNAELAASTVTGRKLDTQMRSVGRRAAQTGAFFTRNLTLPLVLAGVASGKMAANFETSFAKVSGLTNTSTRDVERLKKAALSLSSKQITEGPTALGDAIFRLQSVGFQTNQTIKALVPISQAAAAGLGTTAVVADAVASALDAYGIAGQQAGRNVLTAAQATAVLIGTVTAGKLPPEELARSLGRVIPVANAVGLSFDQVGAAIASMSRQGLNANLGVTGLRSLLQSLLKAQPVTQKALAQIGTTPQTVLKAIANPQIGLFTTLVAVRKEFNKLGNEPIKVSDKTLFEAVAGGASALKTVKDDVGNANSALAHFLPNIRSLAAFLIITGPRRRQNATIFSNLKFDVEHSQEVIKRAYEAKLKTPIGQLQLQLSKLKAIGTGTGGTFITLAADFLKFGNGVITGVQGLDRFFQKLGPLKHVIRDAALGLLLFGPGVSIFGRLTQAASGGVTVWGRWQEAATRAAYAVKGISIAQDQELITQRKATVQFEAGYNAMTAAAGRTAAAVRGVSAASGGLAALTKTSGVGKATAGTNVGAAVLAAQAVGRAPRDVEGQLSLLATRRATQTAAASTALVAAQERAVAAQTQLNLVTGIGATGQTQLVAAELANANAAIGVAEANLKEAQSIEAVLFNDRQLLTLIRQLTVAQAEQARFANLGAGISAGQAGAQAAQIEQQIALRQRILAGQQLANQQRAALPLAAGAGGGFAALDATAMRLQAERAARSTIPAARIMATNWGAAVKGMQSTAKFGFDFIALIFAADLVSKVIFDSHKTRQAVTSDFLDIRKSGVAAAAGLVLVATSALKLRNAAIGAGGLKLALEGAGLGALGLRAKVGLAAAAALGLQSAGVHMSTIFNAALVAMAARAAVLQLALLGVGTAIAAWPVAIAAGVTAIVSQTAVGREAIHFLGRDIEDLKSIFEHGRPKKSWTDFFLGDPGQRGSLGNKLFPISESEKAVLRAQQTADKIKKATEKKTGVSDPAFSALEHGLPEKVQRTAEALRSAGNEYAAEQLLAAERTKQQYDNVRKAVDYLRSHGKIGLANELESIAGRVKKIRKEFDAQFGQISDSILLAFDNHTARMLDGFDRQTSDMLDGFDRATSKLDTAFDRATEKIDTAFDRQTAKLEKRLKFTIKVPSLNETFKVTVDGKTPAEIELAALDKLQEKRDFMRHEDDARKGLANAFLIGDPNGIIKAQQDLEDANLARRKFAKEAQADKERAAKDAQVPAQQQKFQDRRAALKQQRDDARAAQKQILDDGRATQRKGIEQIREGARRDLEATRAVLEGQLKAALDAQAKLFESGKISLGKYKTDVLGIMGRFKVSLKQAGIDGGQAYESQMAGYFRKLTKEITAETAKIDARVSKTAAALALHVRSIQQNLNQLGLGGIAQPGVPGVATAITQLTPAAIAAAIIAQTPGRNAQTKAGNVRAAKKGLPTRPAIISALGAINGGIEYSRYSKFIPKVGRPSEKLYNDFLAKIADRAVREELQTRLRKAGFTRAARGAVVPGSGTGDTVPAMLTPGEVVFNRRQQRTLGRMLGLHGAGPQQLFENIDRPKHFAKGGVVGRTKASPREDLWDAIQRMEKEGYSDHDIAGQVHRWHKSVDVDKLATALHWKRRKKNIWERAASDVATIVKGTPKGLYQLGKLLAAPTFDDIVYGPSSEQAARARTAQEQFAKAAALQPLHDLRHPLRHPVYTFLDIAPGLTKLLQLGAAGRVVRLGDAAKVNLKYSRAGRFAAKVNASQRGFRARDRLIDALGANDVGWKMGLEKGDVFSSAVDRPGKAPLIVDHRKIAYGLEEVPGTERPPKFLYRAISDEEYRVAKKQGFFKSDGRMNLASTEGTVAALSDPSYYLPGKLASSAVGRHKGRIIRIRYAENDGWIFDTDGYVKTQQSIPFGRVDRAPRVDTVKKASGHTVNRVPIGGRLKTRGQNLLDKTGGRLPVKAGISALAEQTRMDVLKEVRAAEWNRGGRELAESTLTNLLTGKTYLARGRGGKLTGVAHLADLRGDKSELVSLATTAGSQGVGRALVERVARDARGEGAKRLNLLSSLSAEPFYEHLGFKRLFEKGGRFEAELPLVDKAKGLSPHELRRHQIHATVRQILHDQTGSLTIGRKFNVQEARTELAQLETKYEGFIDHFLGSGKLTPDEMAEQRAINTVRGRYRRQQSGRDNLGRPSGASGSKVQFLPKNVREQQRLEVEHEVRKIAEQHPELPAARNFLQVSARIGELQQAISSYEERSFLGKGFARGGWLSGHGWKDTVPAMLTPGEIVLNKGQQANLGQMVGKQGASPQALFEHIARAGRYASGGVVQAFAPGGVVSDVVSEHGFRGQVQLPLPIIKGFTDATKSLTKLLTVIARGAARQENLKQDPRTAELILGGVFRGKGKARHFVGDSSARLRQLRRDLDPVNITKLVNDDPRLSKLSEPRKQALEGTLARLQAHPVRGGLITVGKDGKVITGSAAGNTLGVPFAGHGVPLRNDDGSGFLSDAAKRARDRSQQHSVPRNDTLAVPTGGGGVQMTFGAVTVIVQGAENPEKTALAVRRNLQGIAGRNAPRRRGGGAGTRVVGA